jgi:adenylylsulfate reductase subunit B
MPPKFDYDKCKNCGVCVDICPEDVLVLNNEKYPEVKYPYECWHCASCVIDCKENAVHLELPLFMRLIPEPYEYEKTKVIKENY